MSTNNNIYETHLQELGKSKFEIAEGNSDIRGWTVKNEHGKILGSVSDLIFDTKAAKVKYVICNLDGNEMHLQARKVLLPIEVADLDEVHRNAIFPGIMANELTSLPTYENGKITSRMEELVQNAFRSHTETTTNVNNNRDSEERENSVNSNQYQQQSINPSTPASNPTPIAKKQTVLGVFDHTSQAQAAADYLVTNGIDRSRIEITYSDSNGMDHRKELSVTDFFKNLFSDDNEARDFSEAAQRCTLVKVDAISNHEAEFIAEILDKHGAINMEDRIREKERLSAKSQGRKYHSRIINYPNNDNTLSST